MTPVINGIGLSLGMLLGIFKKEFSQKKKLYDTFIMDIYDRKLNNEANYTNISTVYWNCENQA